MYKRLREALNKHLNSKSGKFLKETVQKNNIPYEKITVTCLPDSFEFEGSRIVDGKFCNTVGEYKEAIAKSDSTLGGWHG
jgi:hypothetical protein